MKSFKKVITLLTAALIILSFTACSNDKGTDETNNTSNGENQGNINTSSEIYDFSIDIFGQTYTLPTDLDEFINNGWECELYMSPEEMDVTAGVFKGCNMAKDGKKIYLAVYNLGTSVKKFADCKVGTIKCDFSAENDITLNLPKKLSVTKDTTIEEVTRKFGECPDVATIENQTYLKYEKDLHMYYEFIFDTEEGKLARINIENWVVDEEETIVEENDLSFLSDYVAPDALTDDYADYIFRLEGEMYQFPAPVSNFVDNGWTITTQPDSISGGSSVTGGLVMRKDDNELRFTAQNFAIGPVEPKDAMITGVFMDSEFLNGLDFELSGGITFDMSLSDFESKPFFNQFTSGSAMFGDIQYSYFEAGRSYSTFTFEDDKLVSMSFEKFSLDK